MRNLLDQPDFYCSFFSSDILKGISHSCLCRPQEVVIFIIGGTTYEEARTVALHNATNSGTRFILGGSVVLNSKRYIISLIHSLYN